MKKVFALLMLSATLSFVACDNDTEVKDNDGTTEEVETMDEAPVQEEAPMMETDSTNMNDTASTPAETPAM